MADVAATPFINFGLSQAQQAQAGASANLQNQEAGLTQQQTQAAGIQNQIATARLPFIMRAYEMAGAQTDASGIAGQNDPGGPLAARQDQADEVGFDAATITKNNTTRYNVPEWTPQEQQFTDAAKFSTDPGAIGLAATQREQRRGIMTQNSQNAASNAYAKYAAGSVADDPVSALRAVDPSYYGYLTGKYAAAHPGADLASMAQGYMQYQAADLHKWTGRGIEYKNNIAVDTGTALPVAGVPRLPMSLDKQAELTIEAQKPSVTYQTGKGNTAQMAPYQVAGFKSVQAYLNAVGQGLAPDPGQLNKLTAGHTLTPNEIAQLRQNWKTQVAQQGAQQGVAPPVDTTKMPTDPKNPGALQPLPPRAKPQPQPQPQPPPQQGAPQQGQPPQQGAPQPGQPPQQGAPQPGQPPQGQQQVAQRPQQDSGMLPGVDLDKLPKTQQPQNAPGQSLTPQQTEQVQSTEKKRYADMQDASEQVGATQRTGALITRAQKEIAQLQASPREVGPGSELSRAIDSLRAYTTGKPPNELVNFGMLDKILLQMGAQNIRQALNGQKITNQEFMTMLSHGNPNTAQPLQTIKQLVDYASAGNEYDYRLSNTRVNALRRGADPWQLPGALAGAADRGAFVEARTGVTPPPPGTAVELKTYSAADAKSLPKGTRFKGVDGQTYTARGNGG